MRNPVVILGLSPTGLAIARSLGPRGIDVYGVDSIKYEIGHFSRWIKHDRRICYAPAGPKLLAGLLKFRQDQDYNPVIFIASDSYIDFVAHNRDYLREDFILTDGMSSEVSSIFLNKKTFYERCQKLGILLPATCFPENEKQAEYAAKTLRYPAVVKPVYSYLIRHKLRGQKLVEVSNAGDLLSWWRQFCRWGSASVLQEVIEGPEYNIYVAGLYTDSNLNCLSLFTGFKIRQYPSLYGSGSYVESRWSPEIAALSAELIKQLGYRGICGTEYKWDQKDNAWKLIEVNCRPTLWFALCKAAGVDVIWDAYSDLTGQPNTVNIGRQQDGVGWQFLVRDVASGLRCLRSGDLEIREFFRSVLDPRNKVYAILSSSDINTVAAYPINTMLKYLSFRLNNMFLK